MPSKLGIHINAWKSANEIVAFIQRARPRVIKVLDFNRELIKRCRDAAPGALFIGRVYVSKQPFEDDPEGYARQFCDDQLLPKADQFKDLIDCWESYNEIGHNKENIDKYARFEAERTRILAQRGYKSVVGNFATGTPELDARWEKFFPALQAAKAAGGFLGLHEYSAPFMQWMTGANQMNPNENEGDEGWTTLRYRKLYRRILSPELRLPLIITEAGIDGGVRPRPGPAGGGGWRDFEDWNKANNRGDYLAQLQWFDNEMAKDDYVIGATIYCYGTADPTWQSFDIQGPMADRLAGYLIANPPLPWKPSAPAFDDKTLVQVLATEFGDLFDDVRTQLPTSGVYAPRTADQVQYVGIHHTGASTGSRTYSTTIAKAHQAKGWPGIAYHFLVYPYKVRYCGDLMTIRADLPGRDADAVSVALMGDFSQDPPDPRAIDLARRLLDTLDKVLGRPLVRHGHRDLAPGEPPTDCPGATAFGDQGWLVRLNAVAPPQPLPQPQPVPIPIPGDETAALRQQITKLTNQIISLTQQVTQLTQQTASLNQQVATLNARLQTQESALRQIAQAAQAALQ